MIKSMSAATRVLPSLLPDPLPSEIRVSNGVMWVQFPLPVTACENVVVSRATGTAYEDIPVTPLIDNAGNIVIYGNKITNGMVFRVSGNVTLSGASKVFNAVLIVGLQDCQTALDSVPTSWAVKQGNLISIYQIPNAGDSYPKGDIYVAGEVVEISLYSYNQSGSGLWGLTNHFLGSKRNIFYLDWDNQDFLGAPSLYATAPAGVENILILDQPYFAELSFTRGHWTVGTSNFSAFEFKKGIVLNKPMFGTVLSLNLNTTNAFSSITFRSNVIPDVNPTGKLAIVQGTAKSFIIDNLVSTSKLSFLGGVDMSTSNLTINKTNNLTVLYNVPDDSNFVHMKFQGSKIATLTIELTANALANTLTIDNLMSTVMESILLISSDTLDSSFITLTGTVTTNCVLDQSAFLGLSTFSDTTNGVSVFRMPPARGNTLTLRPIPTDGTTVTGSTVVYTDIGVGDTINNFSVGADKIQFDSAYQMSLTFSTDSIGTTSIFLAPNPGSVIVTLPSTTGFSASNIIFTI